MAEAVISAGCQGTKLVLEYDDATGTVLAIRVDDPNGVLPKISVRKQALTLDAEGSYRYVLPANRRFSYTNDSEWPTFNFGSVYKVG